MFDGVNDVRDVDVSVDLAVDKDEDEGVVSVPIRVSSEAFVSICVIVCCNMVA
jgi:hypothetical protein